MLLLQFSWMGITFSFLYAHLGSVKVIMAESVIEIFLSMAHGKNNVKCRNFLGLSQICSHNKHNIEARILCQHNISTLT